MGSVTQAYTSFLLVVCSIFPIIKSEFCHNYLLTGRNISIKESSVYGVGNPRYIYDPYKALLHSQEETDGQGHIKLASWTAERNDTDQFWQVSLEAPSIVRGVVTQGKNGCCQQWVQEYRVNYSSDCQNFFPVEWKIGQQIFSGNWDESTPVTNFFRCPIKTKCIRVAPVTWHNQISMRFEFFGCPIASTPLHTSSSIPGTTSISSTVTAAATFPDSTSSDSNLQSITSTPILQSASSTPKSKSTSTLDPTLHSVTSSPTFETRTSAAILQSTGSIPTFNSTFTSFLESSTSQSTRLVSTEITTTAAPILESTTFALSLEPTSSGSSLESTTPGSSLESTISTLSLELTTAVFTLESTTSGSTLKSTMSGPSLESTAPDSSLESTSSVFSLESTSAPTLESATSESTLESIMPGPTLETTESDSDLQSTTSSSESTTSVSSLESTTSDPDLQSTTSATAVPLTTSSPCLRTTQTDSTLQSTTSARLSETTTPEFETTTSSAPSTIIQACEDIRLIDCHMLDTYLGICKDSVTAKLYCTRYCGLCGSTTEGATESTNYVPTSSRSMMPHYNHTVASSLGKSSTWPLSTPSASLSSTASTEHTSSAPTFPFSVDFTTATPKDLTTSSAWTSLLTDDNFSIKEETTTSISLTNSLSAITSKTSPVPVSSTTAVSSTDNPLCNNNIMTNISCTFDTGPCGFYIPMFPHIWDLVSQKYGDGAVIHADHSTGNANGKYAVFEANNVHTRFGSSSEMTSSTVPANVSFCLTFWYNMPTNSSACSVYKRYVGLWVADELLWEHSGKETNGWTEASVVLSGRNPFQVVFSSVKTAFDGYFGVDDISFHFAS